MDKRNGYVRGVNGEGDWDDFRWTDSISSGGDEDKGKRGVKESAWHGSRHGSDCQGDRYFGD